MFQAGQSNFIPPNIVLPPKKIIGLVLMLFKLTQCDKQKSAIIIVASGSSLKMGAGPETNELGKGRVFLSTKSNQIF